MKVQPYFEEVYEVVRLIPMGRVTTYGAISNFLALSSARMVGRALKLSFTEELVPAHRVVNSSGILSGRLGFPTPTMMQELLEREGVRVENHKVKNFKDLFWDPSEELL